MQKVGQLLNLVHTKLVSSEAGTLSKTGTEPLRYPDWLRDIFTLMTATYGSLWSNQFVDEQTTEAIKRVWFFQLREFEESDLRPAILEAGKRFAYPPKPAELIEMVKNVQHRKRDREQFRIMDEKRQLPAPPKAPLTREVLQAKVKMWEKLGMTHKAEECLDEISRMDLQEK